MASRKRPYGGIKKSGRQTGKERKRSPTKYNDKKSIKKQSLGTQKLLGKKYQFAGTDRITRRSEDDRPFRAGHIIFIQGDLV